MDIILVLVTNLAILYWVWAVWCNWNTKADVDQDGDIDLDDAKLAVKKTKAAAGPKKK